jgi:hypothetical protein
MQEPGFVAQLKRLGDRLGMRLKEYRGVRLGWGQEIEVSAPYFITVGGYGNGGPSAGDAERSRSARAITPIGENQSYLPSI